VPLPALGAFWRSHHKLRDGIGIFQTSKSAVRDKKRALADLDRTLKTLGLDHLDLWQIHDRQVETSVVLADDRWFSAGRPCAAREDENEK